MFSNIINKNPDENNDKVNVESYTDSPLVVCDINRFSIVVLEYKGTIEVNFDETKSSDFNILFLCPGEIFRIKDYKHVTVVSFDEMSPLKKVGGFDYAYGNIDKLFPLTNQSYKSIQEHIKKLNVIITEKHLEWNRKAFSVIEEIFTLSPTYSDNPNNDQLPLVYSFVSSVHEHYTMYHQISYYANLLEITSKGITEKFYKEGLLNPHSFIKNRILVEVKRQLIYTDKSIKIICFDVGFNDPAYFSRFFKKNVGMTMKEFRVKYSAKFN